MSAVNHIFCVIGSILIISGCCYKFDDLTAGDRYPVGSSITTSGKTLKVEEIGNLPQAQARIDNRNIGHGLSNTLCVCNTNIVFNMDFPVRKITFDFAELGGPVTLKLNSEIKNLSNLVDLNGGTVGGVSVAVDAVRSGANWYGKATFQGTINGFAIAGEELWIDNVCDE
jgi:hypothetical protein